MTVESFAYIVRFLKEHVENNQFNVIIYTSN